jgi:hypothetical protein
MRRLLNARALAGVLIAVGAMITVSSLYADRLGLGTDDDYMGPQQWLGIGLGLFVALIGVGLINKERIKAGTASLSRQTWARLSGNWPLLLAVTLTLLVAAAALFLRLNKIAGALPYPGHIDEPHLSERAGNILKTGQFNLEFFAYPHTPIHLVLGGLMVGYVDAAMHMEVKNTEAIGSLGFPYFSKTRVIWPAKALFAALSVAAMVFMGVVGLRAYRRQSLLWLVPLVILFSRTYFHYSHQYLNVDLAGAFFVSALYLCLFQYLDRDTVLHRSIVPGVFCALTLTCKYSLLWIVVPPILVILLYARVNRLGKILTFLLSATTGFLLLMPSIFVNFTLFLDTLGGLMCHYAHGHAGHEGEPGTLQLVYYLNTVVDAYGLPTLLLAALGIAAAFLRDWKGTLVIGSFPALHLLYLSAQRARFERHIVSAHLFYGLFVAVGILCTYDLLDRLLGGYAPFKRLPRWRHLAVILALITLLAHLLPIKRTVAWAQARPDSRNLATEWIRDNVPRGSALLVAQELSMLSEPLEADYQVTVVPLAPCTAVGLYRLAQAEGDPYVLMPVFAGSKPESSAAMPNRFAATTRTLVEFPGRKVLVDYLEPVPHGNPAFSVGLLEPTPEERALLENSIELELTTLEGRKRITADGSLRLPWSTALRSPPIHLGKGEYEVALVTKGTAVKGVNALFRVHFGEGCFVGEFYSEEDFQETRLAFEVVEEEEASLIVSFVNDGAERNQKGEIIADRNAWIQSIVIQRVDVQP